MLGLRSLKLRAVLWLVALALVPVLIFVAMPHRSWTDVAWMCGALCIVLIPSLSIATGTWMRIRRDLRNNEERFCIKCGYNLADNPGSGTCPECGVKYEMPAVQDAWRRSFPRDV